MTTHVIELSDVGTLPTIVCAWCERVVAHRGRDLSHGICLGCYPRETGVALVSCGPGDDARLAEPPFGRFELSPGLTVDRYECSARCVPCQVQPLCPKPLGLHFFDDVLPPIQPARTMRRWFEHIIGSGRTAAKIFEFILERPSGRQLLSFECHADPAAGFLRIHFEGVDDGGMVLRVLEPALRTSRAAPPPPGWPRSE